MLYKPFVKLGQWKAAFFFRRRPGSNRFYNIFLFSNLLMIALIQSNYLFLPFCRSCQAYQARQARHQVRDNTSLCSFFKLLRDKSSGQDSSLWTRVQPKLGLPDQLWLALQYRQVQCDCFREQNKGRYFSFPKLDQDDPYRILLVWQYTMDNKDFLTGPD